MTEQELRALVRDVVAERLSMQSPVVSAAPRRHASHARLSMVAPTEAGAPCVIEPAVACNQCGYCQSLGH
jgi:hypothetical protein